MDGDDAAEVERARADPRRRVGRYLLVRELGRGGMGVVHRAWDPDAGRFVALKLMLAFDAEAVLRFEREMQAVARLQHPSIVRVFELGRHEGLPFAALELVPGTSLDRLRGPLPVSRALDIAAQVCSALAHAHERGVVHRDLKPANLVEHEGQVKVLDFGLARVEGDAKLTATGAVVGTPAFMPPEQIDGRAEARSDLYALGATLFALLTGQPPFAGSSIPSVLNAVLTKPAPRASSLLPGIPARVDALVARCLEKEPAARFESAGALGAAIEDARRGPGPVRLWRRGLVVVLALLLVAAGAALLARPLPAPEPVPPSPAPDVPLPAPAAPEAAPLASARGPEWSVLAASPDGTTLLGRELSTNDSPSTKGSLGRTGGWQPSRRRIVAVTFDMSSPVDLGTPVWVLPREGGAWEALEPQGETPPRALYEATAIVDPVRECVVLVGGRVASVPVPEQVQGVVWELPLTRTSLRWVRRSVPAPERLSEHSVAWDEATRSVLVYGGRGSSGQLRRELFAYDGLAWRRHSSAAVPPRGRAYAGLAVDEEGHPVLFGGVADRGEVARVWPTARARDEDAGPFASPRHAMAVAWTPVGFLLIGGKNASDKALGDVWVLTDGLWRELRCEPAWPDTVGSPCLVPVGGGELVLFGGDKLRRAWLLRLER